MLCDKQTLKPTYAIELDDYTHNYPDRIERDREVGKMFKQAGLALVRFKDKSPSKEEIIQRLSETRNLQSVNNESLRATESPAPDKTPA